MRGVKDGFHIVVLLIVISFLGVFFMSECGAVYGAKRKPCLDSYQKYLDCPESELSIDEIDCWRNPHDYRTAHTACDP